MGRLGGETTTTSTDRGNPSSNRQSRLAESSGVKGSGVRGAPPRSSPRGSPGERTLNRVGAILTLTAAALCAEPTGPPTETGNLVFQGIAPQPVDAGWLATMTTGFPDACATALKTVEPANDLEARVC